MIKPQCLEVCCHYVELTVLP